MNQLPPGGPSDDEMARAMKRGNGRRNAMIVGLVIVGVGGYAGLFVLRGKSAVESDLADHGYTDVKVTTKGPFTFAYDAQKGTSRCSGTVERMPGSTQQDEMCFDPTPTAAPAPQVPALSNREQLEASLKTNYAQYGFDKFKCPDEVKNTDETAACTATGGDPPVSAPINATLKTHDTDGSWATWSWNAPAPEFLNRATLAADVKKSLEATPAIQARKLTLEIDCGAGPLLLDGKPLTCKASTNTPRKEGTAKVTFDPKEPSNFHVQLDGL